MSVAAVDIRRSDKNVRTLKGLGGPGTAGGSIEHLTSGVERMWTGRGEKGAGGRTAINLASTSAVARAAVGTAASVNGLGTRSTNGIGETRRLARTTSRVAGGNSLDGARAIAPSTSETSAGGDPAQRKRKRTGDPEQLDSKADSASSSLASTTTSRVSQQAQPPLHARPTASSAAKARQPVAFTIAGAAKRSNSPPRASNVLDNSERGAPRGRSTSASHSCVHQERNSTAHPTTHIVFHDDTSSGSETDDGLGPPARVAPTVATRTPRTPVLQRMAPSGQPPVPPRVQSQSYTVRHTRNHSPARDTAHNVGVADTSAITVPSSSPPTYPGGLDPDPFLGSSPDGSRGSRDTETRNQQTFNRIFSHTFEPLPPSPPVPSLSTSLRPLLRTPSPDLDTDTPPDFATAWASIPNRSPPPRSRLYRDGPETDADEWLRALAENDAAGESMDVDMESGIDLNRDRDLNLAWDMDLPVPAQDVDFQRRPTPRATTEWSRWGEDEVAAPTRRSARSAANRAEVGNNIIDVDSGSDSISVDGSETDDGSGNIGARARVERTTRPQTRRTAATRTTSGSSRVTLASSAAPVTRRRLPDAPPSEFSQTFNAFSREQTDTRPARPRLGSSRPSQTGPARRRVSPVAAAPLAPPRRRQGVQLAITGDRADRRGGGAVPRATRESGGESEAVAISDEELARRLQQEEWEGMTGRVDGLEDVFRSSGANAFGGMPGGTGNRGGGRARRVPRASRPPNSGFINGFPGEGRTLDDDEYLPVQRSGYRGGPPGEVALDQDLVHTLQTLGMLDDAVFDALGGMPLQALGLHNRHHGRGGGGLGLAFNPANYLPDDAIEGADYETLLALGERVGEVKQRGLDGRTLAGLPTKIYRAPVTVRGEGGSGTGGGGQWQNVSDDSRCAVCLEDFQDGEELALLPCLHAYHGVCVRTWLKGNGVCPVCRLEVKL